MGDIVRIIRAWAGTYTLIDAASGSFTLNYNGSNFGLGNAGTLNGQGAYFQEGSFQLVILPIPQPCTPILAGLGLAGLTLRRRGK